MQQKGAFVMKEKLHTQSTFKNINAEELKKLVTMKIQKLINVQLKKTL